MDRDNLRGLSPLWLISLAMVLGTVIVVLIPASIASGDAIKSSDWIGFAGNVVAGAMTILAAIVAWLAVQKQIAIQQEIADGQAAFQRFQILQQQVATLENDLRLTTQVSLRGKYITSLQSTYFVPPIIEPWHVDRAREGFEAKARELDIADEEFEVASTQQWAFQGGISTRGEIRMKSLELRLAVRKALKSLASIPKRAKQISAQDVATCLAINVNNEAAALEAACDDHYAVIRAEVWRLGSLIDATRIRAGL